VRALHVFPFFGADLVHGGEAHAYMLSKKLVELGVEVDAFATLSRGAQATSAFSLAFPRDYELRFEESDGIAIHRFPASMALPAQVGHMLSRIVFRRWRREEGRYGAVIGGSRNLVDSYCHRAATRPSVYDAISLLGRGPHSLGLLARLVRSIRAYDVVLVGFMPFALVWQVLRVAKAFRKPVVLLALFHPEDLYHHFRVYYRCFADAAAILAQTAYSAELFARLVPGTRPVQVGPGVDDVVFSQPGISGHRFRAKHGLMGQKVVLYVGRKEPTKRYDLAVKAVDLLRNDDVKLVMIGADIDHQPIDSPRVLYLGSIDQEDLLDAYDACDMFLLPSEHESFGMVFLEAWMRKKPVIGNGFCRPVASMIRDGEDGFVCAGAAPMARAIAQLLANPALARRMGEAGYRRTREHHTWDSVAKKVYDVYQEVARPAGGRPCTWTPLAVRRTDGVDLVPGALASTGPEGDAPALVANPAMVTPRAVGHEQSYNERDAVRFPLNIGSHDIGFRYMFDFTVAGRSLDLRPGATVLDFAAGSCFVSELLNRLGYITTAVDVDPSILRLGRDRLTLDPRCERDRSRFVAGEGMSLPFRDGSFDGIICMNALHHMDDYRTALAEMYRILRPGGRVVFSEPGSEHSRDPMSISAMQQYGAVEKDVVLAEIHEIAMDLGFRRMILKPYVYPEHVDLCFEELDAFRHHNKVSTANAAADEVAAVMERSHCVFYLEKGRRRALTSANAGPERLRARIIIKGCPARTRAGVIITATVRSENVGESIWLAQPRPFGGYVTLGVKLLSPTGRLVDDNRGRTMLPNEVWPGDAADIVSTISLEGLASGQYRIVFDMVNEQVCWFGDMGSPVAEQLLEIA
jgi:glycosyltransferase involved in cell wall biosynthesis/SAM-dependent methyltransferase